MATSTSHAASAAALALGICIGVVIGRRSRKWTLLRSKKLRERDPTAQGLAALRDNEILPSVAPPGEGGHYLPFTTQGDLVFLSGYTSRMPSGESIQGAVVSRPFEAQLASHSIQVNHAGSGAEAARTCALGHLAILASHCGGLANVRRIVKSTCFVNVHQGSVDERFRFSDSPIVANGYTDLMVTVLGEVSGSHARSAVGVASLPGDAAVEVEAVVELYDASLVRSAWSHAA